jgi:flavin-dependent dehydrogenase
MYDVIVCGAGPAGLTFAENVAEKGFDVFVLEKRMAIGEPRHDSGASYTGTVTEHGLTMDVVANTCNGVIFETPTKRIQRVFETDDVGCILARRTFARALTMKALDAGVVINMRSTVLEFTGEGVKYKRYGSTTEVAGRLIVDATGGEHSLLARQMGLSRYTGKKTATVEYEVFCRKIDNPNIAHHGLGDYAPRGYAWMYPTSEKSAIVGCSRINDTVSNVRETLHTFIKKVVAPRAERPQPVEVHSCVNRDCHPEKTFTDKLLVIGSAAKHNNPLWNEGIRYVMHQAKRNAAICSELLEKDALTAKDLKRCEDDWVKDRGSLWGYLKNVHEKGSRLTNKQWDDLLDVLERVDDTLFIKICKSEVTKMDIIKLSRKLASLISTWK